MNKITDEYRDYLNALPDVVILIKTIPSATSSHYLVKILEASDLEFETLIPDYEGTTPEGNVNEFLKDITTYKGTPKYIVPSERGKPPVDFSEAYGMEKVEKKPQKIEPIDDKYQFSHLEQNKIDMGEYSFIMLRKTMFKLNELISLINQQNGTKSKF
jgi:hypothetical protein